MKQELRVIVYGRVQRVMYRDFAARTARRLGLVGTVRNLKDGTVEVVAQGERAVLDTYLARLRRGSLFSHVEKVDGSWHEPEYQMKDFTILYA